MPVSSDEMQQIGSMHGLLLCGCRATVLDP